MKFSILILCLSTALLQAQNRFEKRVDAADITNITLKLTLTNTLVIKTAPEAHIELFTLTEGEYANQTTLSITQKQKGNLIITDVLQPTFENHQDKLSAHKVHAITTTITLPEKKHITIMMASGSMDIAGNYNSLFVQSHAANVQLQHFTGIAKIQAKTGTIQAKIKNIHSKAVTNANKTTHIVTKEGSELFLNSAQGKVIIID